MTDRNVPTSMTIPNIPQEEQDYKALQEYIRLKSYDAVAEACNCSRTAAFKRVQRALERAKPQNRVNELRGSCSEV